MKKIFVVLILLLIVPVVALGGEGGGLVPCSGPDCTLCDLFQLFANIIEFLIVYIVPPVATLFLVYGGIIFLTAGGNPTYVSKGQKILIAVVVGLVIVYGGHLLITAILSVLGAAHSVQWPSITICE